MQAVIVAGGKQHLVEPNQTIEIDLVSSDAKKLTFEPLMVIDGSKVEVGTPRVDGTVVEAEVLGEVKGDKLKVLKFKPKKRINKLTGHRQRYTQIKVTSIGKGKATKSAKAAA